MSEPSRTAGLRPAHWRAALAVLHAVWHEQRVADATLQAWFREHREMGGRDRAQLSGLLYGVLRDAMRLARMCGSAADAGLLLAAHVLDRGISGVDALRALAGATADEAQQCLAACDATRLSDAERLNVPAPVWAAWLAQYGEAEAAALALALNREAPVDLRVNTLKATRDDAIAALAAEGIAAAPTPHATTGLRLARRVALQNTRAWKDGWIEPQDEGSQLLAALVAARAGECVVDYCAGAGGKTLALGAAMRNAGELWALDVAPARLARLDPRARRAGLREIRTQALPATDWHARYRERCDAVLVDAPCSGTGTWRRNPELRLRPLDLDTLAAQQRRILEAAAPLVKPGGRLLYSTCSVLAAENEAVVEAFLREHPHFEPQPAGERLALPALACGEPWLRLLPQRHGTDGFFAACLRRR
ncbi:RsmB/NOP family class I SAM-dependent RNA methyltransferase [Solimonas soli]|uniref:RsmB/NOP family class I SAM-dependent RNA methyltransferase n=1 Tax=Solimonas soli TaxID=413479 RepID=UPI0004B5FBEF|nr:RsmB/NOP family class I SAM-dependent RNA methyltransferase [Solimonas soli]